MRFLVSVIIWQQLIVSHLGFDDDGGWNTDENSRIATPGPCTVDISDDTMSQEYFTKEYAYKKPLIIKRTKRTKHKNNAFFEHCSKEKMLKNYGEKKIRLSSANRHSYDKVDVSLQNYVDHVMQAQTLERLGNETFYWFGDNNYTEWQELFDMYSEPPYKLQGMTSIYSFGLAGAGTGVPFHFHGPGFGEVIFGRKRWFLYPPEKVPSLDPNKTTLQWLVKDYPDLHFSDRPLDCTINQGEIIYFPDRWWHATLNLDTSVFISTFLG